MGDYENEDDRDDETVILTDNDLQKILNPAHDDDAEQDKDDDD